MTNKLKYSRPWSVLRYMLPVTNSAVHGSIETILTQEQWDELMGRNRRNDEAVFVRKGRKYLTF